PRLSTNDGESSELEVLLEMESLSAFKEGSTLGPGPICCHLYLRIVTPGGASPFLNCWPREVTAPRHKRNKETAFINFGCLSPFIRYARRRRAAGLHASGVRTLNASTVSNLTA